MTKRRADAAAWVIVLERWLDGWNWTLYRGGQCADEGFRRTKRDAHGAARAAIRYALARARRGRGE